MDKLPHVLEDYLVKIGINTDTAGYLNIIVLLIALVAIVGVLDYILWRLLRYITNKFASKTAGNFDDMMIANRLPRKVAHIVPLVIAINFSSQIFQEYEDFMGYFSKFLYVLAVFLILSIAKGIFATIRDYMRTLPRYHDKPLNSYMQVFMILAWICGILAIFGIVLGANFYKFITAMGAASAVILLVFRDSILGFVASIQVSINDMVRIGDWITFDKYGADGDVIEINLATVKVQNFDKTITTIPTYALISDSFNNWRGMQTSGGRRIKRSLIIAQGSVRFLSPDDMSSFKSIQLISEYLDNRQEKIDAFNREREVDKSLILNGRNLTNLGVFRKYIETYLKGHSAINEEMTLMCRQLPPGPQGIPLEVYAFSKDKRWENYEYIMADIFDHLIAAVPYFDLEIFELPTSIKNVVPEPNPDHGANQ